MRVEIKIQKEDEFENKDWPSHFIPLFSKTIDGQMVED